MIGQTIPYYEVTVKFGEGGEGRVYRAGGSPLKRDPGAHLRETRTYRLWDGVPLGLSR